MVSSARRASSYTFLLVGRCPASILRQRLVPYVRCNVVHPAPICDMSIRPLDTVRTVAAGLVRSGLV